MPEQERPQTPERDARKEEPDERPEAPARVSFPPGATDAEEQADAARADAERTRSLVAVVAIAWAMFGVITGVSSPRLTQIHAACTLFVAGLYVVALRWPSSWRIVAHLTTLASIVTTTAVALLTGNARAPALWSFVCVPLFSGYLLGVRGAFGWSGVAALALGLVELSRRYHPLPQEQVVPEAQMWLRVLTLMLVVLALAFFTVRVHAAQIAKLGRREAMIRRLLDGLSKNNEELLVARDSALAASRAKGDFLAMMSHEIRTPLNAVLGLAGVLLDGPLAAEQREIVRTIRSSGDSLLLLLNDLLDFSKIEAGRLQLERAPFDVADCAEDAIDLFAAVAHEKGLDLSCHISPDVPARCEGDSGRVRQILVNLVSNAIKFTLRGRVEVHVDAEPITGGDGDVNARIHCSVRDTGIGIPEDHLPRLFLPFSQLDASTTRRFGGTGLGLAICRTLAERMGGRVWAESKRGAGSTFHFTFVAHAFPAIAMGDPESAHGADQAALVVSPRVGTRASVVAQLTGLGLAVQACGDTSEVQAQLASHRPDVVIADESFPPAELREALAKMHRTPAFVILSTARRDTPARRALRERWGPEPIIVAIPVRRGALRDAVFHALGLDETPPPRSSGTPPMAEELPLRILVAEDNPVNQRVALLLLERLGYRADVVGNGTEAVEAVRARPYDVVLMDVRMPEVDGIEATRRIRAALPRARQPRVIALTANAMTEDRETCEEAGMDDFLSKPVTATDLERALRGARARPPATRDSALGAKEIDALRRLTDGSPEIMREIIDEFLDTSRRLVADVHAAAEKGDAKAMERAAHSLKGSSGQMGAQQLMFECAAIERAAAAGDLPAARDRLPSLTRKHEGARARLAALRDAVAG